MSQPRRIKLNYRKVNVEALSIWLDDNNIKYAMAPDSDPDEIYDPASTTIGSLTYFLDVYSAKHETAIRLKWDVEE